MLDIRLKSGHGEGAVYEQGVKGPFGRRVAADYEITVFEPDRRIGFRAIAAPVRPEGAYELEAVDGGTRVTFSLRCAPAGLSKLMSPMVAKTMGSEVAEGRLKAPGRGPKTVVVTLRIVITLMGLGLAGWGHLLVHDLLGATEAWTRADERFPREFRTAPPVAGVALLIMGGVCVLLAIAR